MAAEAWVGCAGPCMASCSTEMLHHCTQEGIAGEQLAGDFYFFSRGLEGILNVYTSTFTLPAPQEKSPCSCWPVKNSSEREGRTSHAPWQCTGDKSPSKLSLFNKNVGSNKQIWQVKCSSGSCGTPASWAQLRIAKKTTQPKHQLIFCLVGVFFGPQQQARTTRINKI